MAKIPAPPLDPKKVFSSIPPDGGGTLLPEDEYAEIQSQKRKLEKASDGQLETSMSHFIRAYKNDPVGFVKHVLNVEPLPWQEKFLEKIADPLTRRISVRAGHGVGKSTACSWALIWHMLMRFPQKSVCTAPTSSQLFDALFSEVKKWVNALPEVLRDSFDVLSDRIVLKASPESSFISARTASKEKPEALAGVHSEHVLLIADEAPGVPEEIFEAAAGSMSGFSATTVLIGNPTRNSGLFFKTHHQLSKDWHTMHVSCLDNPLVSQDFVEQISETYGRDSNQFRVRVMGEFALHEDDTLIAAELVDAAMDRDLAPESHEPIVFGCDIARYGDDRTVICKRQGNVVVDFVSWTGADLMETVGRIMAHARQDKPEVICVDSIGLGAGVADRLREVVGDEPQLQCDVRDVNVSEVAALNPTVAKMRDELWVAVRDWLKARACKLPRSGDLRGELVSPKYTFTSSGKLKVEGKQEMKKRGLRSPDLADALCLTFAATGAGVGGRHTPWVRGRALKRNIRGTV